MYLRQLSSFSLSLALPLKKTSMCFSYDINIFQNMHIASFSVCRQKYCDVLLFSLEGKQAHAMLKYLLRSYCVPDLSQKPKAQNSKSLRPHINGQENTHNCRNPHTHTHTHKEAGSIRNSSSGHKAPKLKIYLAVLLNEPIEVVNTVLERACI